MKKVSPTQVSRLYEFTRQHYVEFYDVQTELVDHMANGIESLWQENPEITFESALQQEFKKFGIFGFMDVLEKRQQAMEKKYFRIILREAVQILKQPKLLTAVFLLFGIITVGLRTKTGYFVLVIGLIIALFTMAIFHTIRASKIKRKLKAGKKVYLLENTIFNGGSIFALVFIPFQLLQIFNSGFDMSSFPLPNFQTYLFAFFVCVLAVVSYLCFYKLPKKKDQILQKTYPELQFSK